MYELTRLIVLVVYPLLSCFTAMFYPLVLPHLDSHWGKTHFPINICSTTYYVFHFTPLGYDEVKPKVPSSLSGRGFEKIVHKNYPYMGQSEVLQILCQSRFDGILSFAHVASMKGSKSGSNAVWMRLRGFTLCGVKLLGNIMVCKELVVEKVGKCSMDKG
jgi:hypothetical protein